MSAEIDTALEIARDVFGWDDVKVGQRAAIDSILSGRDVLCVMPTAYGKSAIYQVAGAVLDGLTVVVSPLIALQNEQVDILNAVDSAPRAVAINSSRNPSEKSRAWEAIESGQARYLFVSPELLMSGDSLNRIAAAGVSLFVVDEAHCVSAWGHDFRPDYLRLGDAVESLGHPRVLALTATGASPVRDEIIQRLGMRAPTTLVHGFDRPNLWLAVFRHQTDAEKRAAVVERVISLPKPGLLYVSTRRDAEEYADVVRQAGITAEFYHGSLRAADRRQAHDAFRDGTVDVIVATSAFGMGIDKPDVRFVVHAAVTASLDDYYQEAGRAGRDGLPAVVELHYRPEDLGLRKFFAARKPDEKNLRILLEVLRDSRARSRREIADDLGISTRKATTLVTQLLEAEVVALQADGSVIARSSVDPEAAIDRVRQVTEQREKIDESRIAMMRAYAESSECRRRTLLGYFGEAFEPPCENCDVCLSTQTEEPVGDESAQPDSTRAGHFPVDSRVTHLEWGTGTVMSLEDDRMTVFFESEGYKVLSTAAVLENKLLTVEQN